MKDHKLYLLNKDKKRWLENRRTKEKKIEIEKINNTNKAPMECLEYMQRIRDTNVRAQLRKIEEELVEKVVPAWKRRPYSVMG